MNIGKIKAKTPAEIQKIMDELEKCFDAVKALQEKDKDHYYTIALGQIKSAYSWLERKGERQ